MAVIREPHGRAGRKTLRWIWLAGAVVTLSAAVSIGAAFSSPRRDGAGGDAAGVTAVTDADRVSDLVASADTAIASGDATTAAALLDEALALDPDNATARRLRRSARAKEPTRAAAPQPPADPDAFLAALPVGSLLPTVVDGYELSFAVVGKADADVSAEPRPGTPHGDALTRVQLSVHDRGNAAGADAYIVKVTKKLYGHDVSSADIAGAKAYVATDGTRLAAVVFVRGRYVFEAVGTAREGSPAAVRQHVIAIARSFPTNP